MDYILTNYSNEILWSLIIIIALFVIALVFICGSDNASNNAPPEVITYYHNGYHSDKSGYQTGKFTKNNTYTGRKS